MITPPEPRRVLIATVGLTGRGGTDIYTRDLALALLRRGWLPIIYTTIAGAFAEELRAATVPIVAATFSLPPEDEMRATAASLERLLPLLHGRPTPGIVAGRLRRHLTNSRMLAYPARLLYQLKRRFGV